MSDIQHAQLLKTLAWLFAGTVLAAVIIQTLVSPAYKQSRTEVLESSLKPDFFVSYLDLPRLVEHREELGITIIDLRNEEAWNHSHIEGAIHMNPYDLTTRKNIRQLRKSESILLYADSEADAMAMAMLLLARGLEQVRLIPGSYYTINKWALSPGADPARGHFREDKARFDYPRFMRLSPVSGTRSETRPPALPEMQTETITVQGGC